VIWVLVLAVIFIIGSFLWNNAIKPVGKTIITERDMSRGVIRHVPCKVTDNTETNDGYSRKLSDDELNAYKNLNIYANTEVFAIYKSGGPAQLDSF